MRGGKPLNMSRSVEEVSKLTESTYKVSACLCEYNRCNERRVKKAREKCQQTPMCALEQRRLLPVNFSSYFSFGCCPHLEEG